MSSEFKKWYDDADMPTLVDGRWVDLETGIPYSSAKPARTILSGKALDARAVAKAFGGKALAGTAKQKEWAEKIRAEKLIQMTAEQAALVADPTNILQNAKFWIENRAWPAREIARFEIDRRALLKKARTLKAANEAAGYAAAAADYNALTARWGFQ
jgi:hypothetical protein